MNALEDLVIIEKIGHGSYSTVYKAQRKTANNECVAVKVVEKAKLSARGREDIVTEIHVMKMLKHKHVVEMKDFKWDDKNIYIIMEYCDGGDLSTFIRKRCKLPEKVCQKFLQQLAIGLQFLRSHDICHLDLKPQNLLLVTKPKTTLKIGDFGFAQFLSDTTQKSSIRGSPLYMAPEMLLGGRYDARADLWSVGVIAYECLFSKAPYSSGSYKELYSRIKNRAPIVIPSDVDLSEDCKDFLRNLLVHHPDKRMNYDSFFKHSFLDLEHVPSEVSYKKALKILQEAERLDAASQHIGAFNKYCEGLRYLFPIFHDETREDKKVTLRGKVCHYTKRAEELKCMLAIETDKSCTFVKTPVSTPPKHHPHESTETDSTSNLLNIAASKEKIVPKDITLKQLCSLCSNTPNLLTAVEIGISAQMYLAEGKYKLALEKFQSSLGILLPCLVAEPAGSRKELLYFQCEEWMKQAESTKSLLTMEISNEQQPTCTEAKETCTIQ